jgi:predicted ArsR family transcriptional regulator
MSNSKVGSKRITQQKDSKAFEVLKVLADPTRFEIFSILEESGRPLTVQEIADLTGLHPNTIRPHLERLKQCGLVELATQHRKRVGRPQHIYFTNPKKPPVAAADRAVRILRSVIAETLARLIAAFNPTEEDALELGRTWGRQLREASSAPPGSRDRKADPFQSAAAALVEDFDLLGFEPTAELAQDSSGEPTLTVVFGDCPYRELARACPHFVCGVHRGMCIESVALSAPELEIEEFRTLDAGEPCSASLGLSKGKSTISA